MSQFDVAEFADNPEPRCPCLLLLDTSESMRGRPIAELNGGLLALRDALAADGLAARRVEIGIVTFGPVSVVCDFQTADGLVPPTLRAANDTPLGGAIQRGVQMLAERKAQYKKAGVAYYRPWILLITDGAPTDAWQDSVALVKEGEESKAFSFFAVGVEGADLDVLSQIAVRKPLRLKGLSFSELFVWLSNSMRAISRSRTGEAVSLQNPATPDGWAFV